MTSTVVVIIHTIWYWSLSVYGWPLSGSPESESVTFSVTSCCVVSKALNHREGLLAAVALWENPDNFLFKFR